MPCLDNLGDFTPKLNTTKKLVILNGSINAIWYLLHLPLVAYVIAILAVQKEHTVVIDNSPFLQLIVDVADNAPYLNADVVLPADIAQYCASAGGPFPCKNSTTEVYKQCASILSEDVVQSLDLQLMKACTRACPFWTERSCFVPPQSLRLDGSSTLELVSFTSFNTGAISASGVDSSSNHVWILLNHVLSAAPIQMTYTFRLSQPAPYFFGSDPRVGDKKTNGDAHSIAVSRSHDVLSSFAPGEKIILTPPDLLAMAGWEWNLNTLLQGGEFSAAVNCYNDVFDLAALNWGGHTPVVPSSERPLCLLSVETLRESSKSTLTDFVTATTAGNTYIRFDTRRGDSYFRLPSLVHLILSLIQCIILLSVPASLSILFATTFLGSLSKILKRAQVEFFFIGFRMPSLGLRLVTDTMALANISPGTDSLETAIIEKELHQALTRLVSHPNPEVSHDMAQHIFKTNQKIQCLAKKHDFTQESGGSGGVSGCEPCDLANLICIGQRARAREVAAYFDRSRRRSCLEWSVLPDSHRAELRRRNPAQRAQAQQNQSSSQALQSASASVAISAATKRPPLLSRLSSHLSALQPIENMEMVMDDSLEDAKPPTPTERELLLYAKREAKEQLQELKNDVEWMNNINSNKTKAKDQKREEEREKRRADIRQLLQVLASAEERLNAKVTSAQKHESDLLRAFEKKESLERRLQGAAARREKLVLELRAFRSRVSSTRFQPPPPLPDEFEGQCLIQL